jgi:flagellar protein FlaG
MINNVKAGTSVPDGALNQRSPRREHQPQPPKPATAREAAAASPDSDLRLVIERDPNGGDYVYRLVDRTTGKVVTELPRDQVSELATAPTYAAGTVVSTKA